MSESYFLFQYSYRRHGRRRRDALMEISEMQSKYGQDKDQWFMDVSAKDEVRARQGPVVHGYQRQGPGMD